MCLIISKLCNGRQKKHVEQAIAEVDASIQIVEYIRFELGEGIEKKKKKILQQK